MSECAEEFTVQIFRRRAIFIPMLSWVLSATVTALVGGSDTLGGADGPTWLCLSTYSTSQSSTQSSASAARAVDGNVNGTFSQGSCTQTQNTLSPWWKLDLQDFYEVTSVKISNRNDTSTLSPFRVKVGGRVCKDSSSIDLGATLEVTCTTPLTGSSVMIDLPTRTTSLDLCEVQVKATLVPWISLVSFTATQASTTSAGNASRAIDGSTANGYWQGSCTHTEEQANPWWQVSFDKAYVVAGVKVTNRGDCCGDRLNGFDVFVDTYKCAGNVQILQGQSKMVPCDYKMAGRFAKVVIPRTATLNLCEVEVAGTAVSWLPLSSFTVAQSSTSSEGTPRKAIDGSKSNNFAQNSCTHTEYEVNPWWRIDFAGPQTVALVQVTNRLDDEANRLNGFKIQVGNLLFQDNVQIAKGETKVVMKDNPGTYVSGNNLTISLKGTEAAKKVLWLCEVQVSIAPKATSLLETDSDSLADPAIFSSIGKNRGKDEQGALSSSEVCAAEQAALRKALLVNATTYDHEAHGHKSLAIDSDGVPGTAMDINEHSTDRLMRRHNNMEVGDDIS